MATDGPDRLAPEGFDSPTGADSGVGVDSGGGTDSGASVDSGAGADTQAPPPAALPAEYDAIVSVEQLVHGEHNPRRVPPTAALRRSIASQGLQRPLIVRPDGEYYQVTDGWQRYQAATDLGWERLPIQLFEEPLAALEATETASIVREWSTYEWARYCRSVARELQRADAPPDLAGASPGQVAAAVADRTARSAQTVRRYLAALSLPEVVHPLFSDGPEGTEVQWATLKHYYGDVRTYGGLSWRVAGRLGKRFQAGDIGEERAIATAANAVAYDTDRALEFVSQAAETPTVPLRTVHERVTQSGAGAAYLQVPSVAVRMSDAEKAAVMAHCADQRVPLSELVATELQGLAADLVEDD